MKNMQLTKLFLEDLVALKRAGRSKTRPDWMATEEAAAAVEVVLKW